MFRQTPLSGISAQPQSGISDEEGRRTLKSLDRFSSTSRNISNRSMRQVMSLQKSQRSIDIYDQWLQARNEKKAIPYAYRMSMSIEEESQQSSMIPEVEPQVRSDFIVDEQIKDVHPKRKSLMVEASQNQISVQDPSKIKCTCTKIQCLKAYCQCFKAGLKCGRECRCEGCGNWGREEFRQVGSPYLEQLDPTHEMPTEMEFEPAQFRQNRFAVDVSRGY